MFYGNLCVKCEYKKTEQDEKFIKSYGFTKNNFYLSKENKNIKDKKEENKNKNDKNVTRKEKSKLSGLSSEMLNFYFEIDEFRKETLIKKINETINGNLKEATVNEIKEKRKKFNVNLNV